MKLGIQCLLMVVVLVARVHAESLAVTDVRFWSVGDVTRIAIELTGEFVYSQDRLTNPERLFFDLKGAHSQVANKPYHSIRVNDGLVKQIRVGASGQLNTRVVLDLAAPGMEFAVSQLSVPDRLIIEVKKKVAMPATAAGGAPAEVSRAISVPMRRTFQPPREPERIRLRAEWIAVDPPPAIGIQKGTLLSDFARLSRAKFPPGPVGAINVPEIDKPMTTPPLIGTKKGSIPQDGARMARAKFPPRPAIGGEVVEMETPMAAPAKNKESGNSMTRALGLKIRRVVIDPGHGGRDEGSRGPSGLREKDLVLDVSKRLGELVEQSIGAEVVFTRDDDRYIPLERRTQIANEHRADLFLSIHANSSSLKIASGVETYYLSFTTSKAALETAARENAASERSVFELKEILQKIALKDKVDESRDFAVKVQSSLFSLAARNNPAVRNRGIKKAPFIVLIGAQMPSILAEIGFVSNAKEEALLKTPAQRQKIAEALLKGMEGYLTTLSHFEVAHKGE